MKHHQYHATKIKPLVQIICSAIRKNPELLNNEEYLMATLGHNIVGFSDPSKCLNCGASMAEYIFRFSTLDALLLQSMGEEVKAKLDKGIPFTEANKVHTPTLTRASHNVIKRSTYTSKLGLIAKFKHENKQVSGMWVITSSGWEALRGGPCRSSVTVYRGQILQRDDSPTTIKEVFEKYHHQNKDNGKYATEIARYDQNKWFAIAGYHQGKIL